MAERLCRVGAGPDRRLRNARHPDEPARRGRSMTRVTNLAAQNLSLALLQQTQSLVMDAQVQISTGKKAERYMGVAPDAARLVSVKADHARVTQFVAGNEIVDLRLQRMESSIAGGTDERRVGQEGVS